MKQLCYFVETAHQTDTGDGSHVVKELQHITVGPIPDRDFDANYAIAQREAYNGEITVEDIPDLDTEPSQEEDTAAMLVDHEYRLTLLELGLTE